jgi:putative ABC transport system ATP-binding protein
MNVLEARDVSKVFGSQESLVRALSGVTFQVRPGEFVAIMGPSGSGKSTLLYLLAGLDDPSSGQVILEGTDLATLNDDQRTLMRRRRIGFVFQAFNLLPHLTAEENVAMPLVLEGVRRPEALARAAEGLQMVGLSHRRGQFPSKMSGGEQQRVTIARALVIRPAIIFADEPTGNLDSESGAEVTRLLGELCLKDGRTILLVTHDSAVGAKASRLIRLRDGRIEQDSGVAAAHPTGV